ncbi:MAG: class I SAM-dependent methyltransferase [Planctomycetaceae bacterium]|nr:class I SAM-dependent methyltransferase [Planctomycetaceae bacterium]
MSDHAEHYILATGGRDVERLRILHEVYGPGTEALFHRVGLRPGLRVALVGCGSGNVACWVAEQVAPGGHVVGIDISSDQIEQARLQAQSRGLTNIEFHVADAYAPRLPEGSFDLAYCRLVLMHLTHPVDALRAMWSLVKPGGTVLCEEMNLGCWLCDPPAEAMSSFFRLNDALGDRRGENFHLGASLHRLFREAGFERPEVSSNFVMAVRGRAKRLLWMTFVQFAPELVREGLATQEEVDRVAEGLKQVADDETTLFGFPLVAQVWCERR